jgi:hypothetical protein
VEQLSLAGKITVKAETDWRSHQDFFSTQELFDGVEGTPSILGLADFSLWSEVSRA